MQSSLSPKARAQLIGRGIVAPALMLGLLFLAAGRWDYWQGWVYSGLN